jgi:hypothetical protein
LDADPLLKELEEAQGYVSILEASLKADRIAYIDPTSQYSLKCLRQKLQELPPINLNQMQFNGINPERLGFHLHFGPYLGPLIVLLQSRFDSKCISDATLEECEQSVQKRLTRKRSYVEILQATNDPVNADQVLVIKQKYTFGEGKTDPEEERLKARLRQLMDHKVTIETSIQEIEAAETIIGRKRWELPEGIGITNRFLFEHQGDVPYSRVEENLEEGTSGTVLERTPTLFRARYTSSDAYKTLCEFGARVVKCVSDGAETGGYILGAVTALPGILIDAAALGVVSLKEKLSDEQKETRELPVRQSDRNANTEKSDTNFFDNSPLGLIPARRTCAIGYGRGGLVSGVLGGLFGVLSGAAQSIFWSRRCAGEVVVYARARDVPANAASLEGMKKELEQLNENEQEENARLSRYQTERQMEIKSRIEADIVHDAERIETIAMIRSFRVIAESAYLQREQDIKCCASILNKLPDRRQGGVEQNVVDFCSVWRTLDQFQGTSEAINGSNEQLVNTLIDQARDAAHRGECRFTHYQII